MHTSRGTEVKFYQEPPSKLLQHGSHKNPCEETYLLRETHIKQKIYTIHTSEVDLSERQITEGFVWKRNPFLCSVSDHFPLNLQVNPSWTPFNAWKKRGQIDPLPLQNKWKLKKPLFGTWSPTTTAANGILTLSDLHFSFALISP